MSSYSGNAVAAKVMAMYGKRLTARDYDNLLERRTVAEVSAYLKMETGYASLIGDVGEDQVRRKQLENAIRRRTLNIYLRLARYSKSDSFFLWLFLRRSEIEQLLQVIRLINSGGMERYAGSLPDYLPKHMGFDLFKLAKARDFEGMLELLKKTNYYHALARCRPESDSGADVSACEAALLSQYYKDALALADKNYPGKSGDTVRRLLYMEIDLYNIALLIRIKYFAGVSPDLIRQYLIDVKTELDGRALDDMIKAKDSNAVKERLRRIPALRECARDDGLEMEFSFERHQQRICRKALRYSRQPAAMVMGYMTMLRIETSNIINIIEGTRYKLPVDEIRRCLVL